MKTFFVNLINLLICLFLFSNNLYANKTSIFTNKELFLQYSGSTLKVSFPDTKARLAKFAPATRLNISDIN